MRAPLIGEHHWLAGRQVVDSGTEILRRISAFLEASCRQTTVGQFGGAQVHLAMRSASLF